MRKLAKGVIVASLAIGFSFSTAIIPNSSVDAASKQQSDWYKDYYEMEGQVGSIDKEKITLVNPFGAQKTYYFSNKTRFKTKRIVQGDLVELSVRNDVVTKIEVEDEIDIYAQFVSYNNDLITLEQNGIKKTFKTSDQFYMKQKHKNRLKPGALVEASFDENIEISELEVKSRY